MLKTAIRLKQALTLIPTTTKSIGHIKTKFGLKYENGDETSEDEDEDSGEEEDEGEASDHSVKEADVKYNLKLDQDELQEVNETNKRKLKQDEIKVEKRQKMVKQKKKKCLTQEILNKCTGLINSSNQCFYKHLNHDFCSFWDYDEGRRKNYNIKIKHDASGVVYDGDINRIPSTLLKQLYEKASNSGFGNVKTQTTDYDSSVRDAKEITSESFTVDKHLLLHIAEEWGKNNMTPSRVRVEPYKINFYAAPNGSFKEHRDTPQENLVGSALLGLFDNSNESSGLILHTSETSKEKWRASAGSFICFYPSVLHEVLPVTTGLRVSLSFKVFYDQHVKNYEEIYILRRQFEILKNSYSGNMKEYREKFERDIVSPCSKEEIANRQNEYDSKLDCKQRPLQLLQDELKQLKTPFGIILKHDDSLNSESLSGNDLILYNFLKNIPEFDLSILHFMTQFKESEIEECEYEQSVKVFPITDEIISYCMGETRKNEFVYPKESIPFFIPSGDLAKTGYVWESNIIDRAENVGNESRWYDEKSIYLHRAIIVKAKEQL
jgi:hypothetical protein